MEGPVVVVVVSGARQQPAARETGNGKRGDFVHLKVVEEDSEDNEEKDKLEHPGPTVRWHRRGHRRYAPRTWDLRALPIWRHDRPGGGAELDACLVHVTVGARRGA